MTPLRDRPGFVLSHKLDDASRRRMKLRALIEIAKASGNYAAAEGLRKELAAEPIRLGLPADWLERKLAADPDADPQAGPELR